MLRNHKNRFIIITAFIVLILVTMQMVLAHGSMADPISRVYHCYLEGPESPDSVVCSDVIESGGTQQLYDWNEINISMAAGNHQAIIPDGQLCSAGREKYAAFDEPRTDWPRTIMPDSGPYTFLYSAYVPHNQGYFELWVTKDGYDPTQPLTWADIEMFALVEEPPVVDGYYVMTVDLPEGKSGHHVIYTIWQRNDSPEAFYACSDVWFGTSPTPTPTTAPACTAAAWNSALTYETGDIVSHNGAVWHARWGNSGNEPSGSAEPWRIREYCSSDGSVTPVPTTPATAVPTDEPTTVPSATATTPSGGSSDCVVTYEIPNEFYHGFQAQVTITNNSATPIDGYTLTWTHQPGQVVQSAWNVTLDQVGNDVTATNPAGTWMGMIDANGGSQYFGFIGTLADGVTAAIPTDFVLNGVACNGDDPQPTPTNTPTPTPGPTDTPTPVSPNSPDLVISNVIFFGGTNPGCGSHPGDIGTLVEVRNQGGTAADSFAVQIEGSLQQTVSGLQPGTSTTVLFAGMISSSGTAVVDVNNEVVESVETNNTFDYFIPVPTQAPPCTPTSTATAEPTDLPDLLIPFSPSVTLETAGCYDGESLGTRVTVRNDGTADAGAFVVDINGSLETVSGLAAGASTSIWVSGYSNPAAIVVDVNNQVAESDEDNNTFDGQLPLPTTPAPCPTETPTATPTSQPTGGCAVDYVIANDWGAGFTANVTIFNNSASAINGWTVEYSFPANQTITNAWNGTATQVEQTVTVTDAGWNSHIPANGGSVSFGFNANYSGSNDVPTSFTLNGTLCTMP